MWGFKFSIYLSYWKYYISVFCVAESKGEGISMELIFEKTAVPSV